MKCFKCAKGKMVPAITGMTATVRREQIPVRTEAMLCNRCGFHVMTDAQSDAYTIASADAYRTKHGLLTTKELKQIRQRLGPDEKLVEGRVLPVGRVRRHRELDVAAAFQAARAKGAIDQRDSADLDVVFGRDDDLNTRLDTVVGALERGSI